MAAISGPADVAGHSAEMICGVRAQALEDGADVLIIISSLGLVRCSRSVVDGSSILEVHSGAQSVGINEPVEVDPIVENDCPIADGDRRPSWAECSHTYNVGVATRAVPVICADPIIISGVCA